MTTRRRRILAGIALAIPVLMLALWLAIHRVPWLGPWFATGLRAVIGPAAVARVETLAYGFEDRFNRMWRKSEAPKAHWQAEEASPPTPAALHVPGRARTLPPFRPRDVGPVHKRVTTPIDGVWMPIRYPGRDLGAPILYKTQLHPDAKRPWAALFVVAIDLRRARLFAVAGSKDPVSTTPAARSYSRPARIPDSAQPSLLAAFNGGFKTEHGQYGMMVDGVTLVRPRNDSCTVVGYKDGSLGVGTWKRLAAKEAEMAWWRQTPPCMYENGKMHGALWDEGNTNWGAAVGGDVVIRRSAIGLDRERRVLYVSIGDYTTARAVADGMHHVGAHDSAHLDVNWSYPKFVVYQQRAGRLQAEVLVEGFVFQPDEYIGPRAPRDFFYLTRVEPDEQ